MGKVGVEEWEWRSFTSHHLVAHGVKVTVGELHRTARAYGLTLAVPLRRNEIKIK